MNKILLTIFCLFLLSLDGFGQEYRVVDAENRESLPYATVLFQQASKGVYADRDGVFVIPNEYSSSDTISISMIGYTPLDIKISDLTDTIFLAKTAYSLQSIVVTPGKKEKSKLVGFHSSGKRISWLNSRKFTPVRAAVHIKNSTGAQHKVDRLLYRHKQYDKDIRFIVRSQVYKVNEDDTPGVSLLHNSNPIILSGNGILEVKIEEMLMFPIEGLFVGIEIMDAIDNDGGSIVSDNPIRYPVVFTSSYKEPLTHISYDLTRWTGYNNKHMRSDQGVLNFTFGLSYK